MTVGNVCRLCGYSFDDENLEESIEKHIKEKHYIDYRDYYEIITTGDITSNCWNCGGPRYMVSPWIENSFLPCSCCIDFDNKHKLKEVQETITSIISGYQNSLLRNRYYQYILSLTKNERRKLLPKSFEIISGILQEIKKYRKTKIDRSNQIFKVVNQVGTSSEISSRNIENLNLEVYDLKVQKMEDGSYKLGDLDLYVRLPEITTYDNRHHSRNSILNPTAKRASKRLRFNESGECIKFYSPPNQTVKSILILKNKKGKTVNLRDLPEETQWKVKFGILKTKEILGRVFEIYNEILKFLSWIEDPVCILNSLDFPFPNLELGMILSWSWEDQDYENKGGEIIKLSIL